MDKTGKIDEAGLSDKILSVVKEKAGKLDSEEQKKYRDILLERVKDSLRDRAERKKQAEDEAKDRRTQNGLLGKIADNTEPTPEAPKTTERDMYDLLTIAAVTGGRVATS
jgi:hypothetical protein